MDMRGLVLLPLLPALAFGCVKEAVLAKDPLLPIPSIYQASWEACQKSCEESLLCQSFSFKSDTAPAGGCWLFPKTASLKDVEDAKAVTGPKICAKVADVAPVAPAGDKVNSEKVPGLRGYGIPAAAAHSYGVANAGHQVPKDVFGDGSGAKTFMAQGSGNGSMTSLAIAGGVGAALVAVGAYMMIPSKKKKKTTRGLQREEEMPMAPEPIPSPVLMAPPAPLAVTQMPQPIQQVYMPQMYMQGLQAPQIPQMGQYHMVEPVTQMAMPIASSELPTYQPILPRNE